MSETPDSPAAAFLDQSEVNQLLTPEPPATEAAVLAPGENGIGPKVERYDFRNPVLLSESEQRRLRALQDDFVRYVSARLSLYLRMEFGLKISALTTHTYGKFTDALPTPTHLSLFKLEPLAGIGILDLNPRLALTIADRLLGGRGQLVKADRPLTEIEIALVEDVVVILLEEWCEQFKSDQALRPVLVGHENNGRFLQTASRDAIMLCLTLECRFGDCLEQIQISVPYYTIEPLVKSLQARQAKDTKAAPAGRRAAWQPSYDGISVPVRAEWQAFELTLRELTELRPGDVIEMPASVCAETQVLLNGLPKFVGTVGLNTDRVAVQLTQKLSPENSTYAQSDGR